IGKFGHDRLPTFGVGKEYGKQEWRSIFRQLHGAGIIALDITGHGTWSVTETGRRVLKGAARVTLRQDTLKPATRKAARAADQCGSSCGRRPRRYGTVRSVAPAALGTRQGATGRRLCGLRRQDADRHGAPQARHHGRDERRARRRRGETAPIWRGFPRCDPPARGWAALTLARLKIASARGQRASFGVLHGIPRYVSKTAIFAGRAGHSPGAPNFRSRFNPKGLLRPFWPDAGLRKLKRIRDDPIIEGPLGRRRTLCVRRGRPLRDGAVPSGAR